MDLPDVCRCYDVPSSQSFYLDVQLFLNGEEIDHPHRRKRPADSDKYMIIPNSWYLLHIKKEDVDEYEDLEPQEYTLGDGRIRYTAKLPMISKIRSGDSSEKEAEIEDACKYFNVPLYGYERFELFIDGKIAEHPSNKISKRTYKLPCGKYYVGDPLYLLNGDEIAYGKFLAHNGDDRIFSYKKHKAITIATHADDSYPLYKITDKLQSKGGATNFNHIDSIITETATICFLPLDLLYTLGCKLPKIKRPGFTFTSENQSALSDDKQFSVVITYKGGWPQYVEFLNYTILIEDKNRFED